MIGIEAVESGLDLKLESDRRSGLRTLFQSLQSEFSEFLPASPEETKWIPRPPLLTKFCGGMSSTP